MIASSAIQVQVLREFRRGQCLSLTEKAGRRSLTLLLSESEVFDPRAWPRQHSVFKIDK
jgi:hypothetical protein